GDELTVLELDAVHRHGDAREIDLLVVAVEEIVITRNVRAVVADVAEERALRTLVIERERERANGSRRRAHADAHVHRDAEVRVLRALQREYVRRILAGLMVEEIDGVAGVVPQKVIRPAARLALEVDVLPAEKERLHDEVLELELAFLDP